MVECPLGKWTGKAHLPTAAATEALHRLQDLAVPAKAAFVPAMADLAAAALHGFVAYSAASVSFGFVVRLGPLEGKMEEPGQCLRRLLDCWRLEGQVLHMASGQVTEH